MTLQSAAGRIALEWLFSETFPLHTQFVEQPQPLRKWELGKWHDCAAYSGGRKTCTGACWLASCPPNSACSCACSCSAPGGSVNSKGPSTCVTCSA